MWEPPQKNISRCVNGLLWKSSIIIRKKAITKQSKAPPERQWKLNPSWKVISLISYPNRVSWKWDELIQTIMFTGSDSNEHCKLNVNWLLEVNIYQNKNILKEKTSYCTLLYTCIQIQLTSIMWPLNALYHAIMTWSKTILQ